MKWRTAEIKRIPLITSNAADLNDCIAKGDGVLEINLIVRRTFTVDGVVCGVFFRLDVNTEFSHDLALVRGFICFVCSFSDIADVKLCIADLKRGDENRLCLFVSLLRSRLACFLFEVRPYGATPLSQRSAASKVAVLKSCQDLNA